jgi:hypothetical protein
VATSKHFPTSQHRANVPTLILVLITLTEIQKAVQIAATPQIICQERNSMATGANCAPVHSFLDLEIALDQRENPRLICMMVPISAAVDVSSSAAAARA